MKTPQCATFSACFLAVVSTASFSLGATVTQIEPNGLAFHGRKASATSGIYEITSEGTDIGGTVYESPSPGYDNSVMWIAGQDVGTGMEVDVELSDGVASYAEYDVRFTNEGIYRVWISGQRTSSVQSVGEGDTAPANDSLWVGPLDQDHTGTDDWTLLEFVPGGVSYRQTDALWTIDNTNVNTDLTFALGLREDGPIYDRIAFVLEGSGIGPEALTVVPEPSSVLLAMFAVGLGAVGMRRNS